MKTGVILQPRGSKVADSPSANNSCHPLFTGPRWLRPPPAVATAAWHRPPGAQGASNGSWGQVSLNWDNNQTSQRTHANTLVSYYAVSSLMWIHLFPSCFIAEVRRRPCLGRRSAASSQSTNADKLKVPFRCLPFWRNQLYNISLNSVRPGNTAGNTLLDTVSREHCFLFFISKVNQTSRCHKQTLIFTVHLYWYLESSWWHYRGYIGKS